MYGIMAGMEKTTVYLTSQQKSALVGAAQAEGRSEAALIRAGLEAVLAGHRAGEARPAATELLAAPVRTATPLARPRWIDRASFLAVILRSQADAGLRRDLRVLAPGTTDDEPLP